MSDQHTAFMEQAIALSVQGMENNEGGPFGAIVVKDGKIIGKGNNRVTLSNDPTAHAEVTAIRDACKTLGNFQLTGCTLYTSCEPCPMCLGAIYWARPDKVYFGSTRQTAADAGFDDDFIYREINVPPDSRKIPFQQILVEKADGAFRKWKDKEDKTPY